MRRAADRFLQRSFTPPAGSNYRNSQRSKPLLQETAGGRPSQAERAVAASATAANSTRSDGPMRLWANFLYMALTRPRPTRIWTAGRATPVLLGAAPSSWLTSEART
jgi:hypothetical protein